MNLFDAVSFKAEYNSHCPKPGETISVHGNEEVVIERHGYVLATAMRLNEDSILRKSYKMSKGDSRLKLKLYSQIQIYRWLEHDKEDYNMLNRILKHN